MGIGYPTREVEIAKTVGNDTVRGNKMKVSDEMKERMVDYIEYAAQYPSIWEESKFEEVFDEEYRSYKSICYISAMADLIKDNEEHTGDYDDYIDYFENKSLIFRGCTDGSEAQEKANNRYHSKLAKILKEKEG